MHLLTKSQSKAKAPKIPTRQIQKEKGKSDSD